MEQEEKVAPLESNNASNVCMGRVQRSPETKDSETATKHRPETEIVTNQCKKLACMEKEVDDHVVIVEAMAIRPEVKVESRSAVDEVAKPETEMTGKQKETTTTTTSSSSSSSFVDKASSSGETSEKALTSAESKRDFAPINPGIIATVQRDMAVDREPETSRTITTTSGFSSRETVRSQQTKSRRSNSVESDKEISEILRNAPPPSVLSEEEEEEEENEEEAVSDETGTVVIMKKTFTESIKPGQEFKPIADEFCPPHTPSAALPCRLEHPVPSSSTTTATTTTAGQPSNNSDDNDDDGKVVATADVDSDSKTESKEEEEKDGGRSILSKARNEARDLTSELRRLQYFLENLSSFTELEIASFQTDDSSSAMTQIDSAQPNPTPAAAAAAVREDSNAVSSVDNV